MLPFKKIHLSRLIKLFQLLIIPLCALSLLISAYHEHLHLYLTPSEFLVQKQNLKEGQTLQIGGLVKQGSLIKNAENVTFILYDQNQGQMTIHYSGSLPSLFKEGQGAIVEAQYHKGALKASRVYVKHDENYSPPKVSP